MAFCEPKFLIIFLLIGPCVSKTIDNDDGFEPYKTCQENKKPPNYMDDLIKDYSNQKWEPDEAICFKKTLQIMENVKNSTLWATWIWDSMQSPVGLLYGSRYSLGNYDECIKAPWVKTHSEYVTQYCLADIKLSDQVPRQEYVDPNDHSAKYINTITKYRVEYNKLIWGICAPAECKPKSVAKFVKILFKNNHIRKATPAIDITVDNCTNPGITNNIPIGVLITVFFFILLPTAVITLTLLNKDPHSDDIGSKLIKACCMKKNFTNLSKTSNDDIKVMHGIRTLNSLLVIIIHVCFVTLLIGTSNTLDFENALERFLKYMFNIAVVVDTYFMMSGLLFMRGLMKLKTFNPVAVILKRYLRLTLLLVPVIIAFIFLMDYCGDGPIWEKIMRREIDTCSKNWWISFLMLGNYVDFQNSCYPLIWSVYCDFHLSVVAMVLYGTYRRNRRAGFFAYLLLVVEALVMPGLITYQYRLPAFPSLNMKLVTDYRKNFDETPTYITSHLRGGPYLVGIAAGYFLSQYKPSNYRKTISKVWSIVGLILSLLVAIVVLVLGTIVVDNPYNVWTSAIFASLNRSVWALAMASIIFLSEYGTASIVTELLTWSPFIPLSKLTYGTYLVHMPAMIYIGATVRAPMQFSFFLIIIYTSGLMVTSYLISLFLNIFFEAPVMNIVEVLTKERYSTKTELESKTLDNNADISCNNDKKIL